MDIALNGNEFILSDTVSGWRLRFTCAAHITPPNEVPFALDGHWTVLTHTANRLVVETARNGVSQQVELRLLPEHHSTEVHHRIINGGSQSVTVHGLRTVDGVLESAEPLPDVSYLHSLNARHDLLPLCPLQPDEPSLLLGKVPYPFFEGLAIWQAHDRPCIVTGPVTQNLAHRSQQLTWDGGCRIRLNTEQELRGIPGKALPPGEILTLDGVFIQLRHDGDLNEVFADYLTALRAANGSRWEQNVLRREFFFAPWNNYLYWHATEGALLSATRWLREYLPTVRWMNIDDGYQASRVNPPLQRLPDGELDYDLPTELVWWRHNPGVTFAFTEGDGEDRAKFPAGLLGLARQIRAAGLRPGLWLGIEASQHTPVAEKHPDWFQPVREGERWLLDVSIPDVRAEIERVFRTYYHRGGFESIKLDFWSPLFEHPNLAFRSTEKTAAEWRTWFFEMVRSCLPDDGFISLGCDLSAGAPFLARWVDSYRHSMDMRDGDWENVKRNVRWSLVPLLTHGCGQPVADADSMSLFKRLTLAECQCWADYAYVTGSLVEIGGNPQRWQAEQVAWFRQYLDVPCAGERVWIGDVGAWQRDTLPTLFYRRREAGDSRSFLASLHNWHDEACDVSSLDWAGPIRSCTQWADVRSGERGPLAGGVRFHLPPRNSRLLQVWTE